MGRLDPLAVRKTWIFLGAIATAELAWLLFQLGPFLRAVTLREGDIPTVGWIAALVVAAGTIAYSVRALNLGPYMTNVSTFRLLGLFIAVPSAIVEETVFRGTVMTLLARAGQGDVVQVVVSALVFGIVHAVWGLRGGWRSFVGAVTATSILGALLAVVYLLSERALLTCVVAHFLINIALEPWLGYAFALRAQGTSVNRSTAA
jgi:hypothetical protein